MSEKIYIMQGKERALSRKIGRERFLELRRVAEDLLIALTDKASRLHVDKIELPKLLLDYNGQAAGVAYPDKNVIRLNPLLMDDNLDEFVNETIAHEFSHIVNRIVNGPKVKAHGPEWKTIMRDLGYKPDRTHAMDVTSVLVAKDGFAYVYSCDCTSHVLTKKMHGKIVKGTNMLCNICRARLILTKTVEREL